MTANTPLQQRLISVMEPGARYTAGQLAGRVDEDESLVQRALVRLAADGAVETDGDQCASQPLWTTTTSEQ